MVKQVLDADAVEDAGEEEAVVVTIAMDLRPNNRMDNSLAITAEVLVTKHTNVPRRRRRTEARLDTISTIRTDRHTPSSPLRVC